MQINIPEYEKQKRESILDSEQYVRMEVLIGKEDNIPVVTLEARKVTSKEMAYLITSLKETIKTIIKKDPMAGVLSLRMGANSEIYEDNQKE